MLTVIANRKTVPRIENQLKGGRRINAEVGHGAAEQQVNPVMLSIKMLVKRIELPPTASCNCQPPSTPMLPPPCPRSPEKWNCN
jgi:hypothetical protein